MSSEQEILTDEDKANGFSVITDDRDNITLLKRGKTVAFFSAILSGKVVRASLELIKFCEGKKYARSGENIRRIRG